ncbi:unnamed protein product [Adineta ricciae]|nr:unnamed protein product [Adineta ricciae]
MPSSVGNAYGEIANVVNGSNAKVSTMSPNIAIIGSSGFIGSRLLQHLQEKEKWNVVGYDRVLPQQVSHETLTKHLQKFEIVIYLAGLSDRSMDHERPNDIELENVKEVSNFAQRMSSSQLLIFASTAEIAEGYRLDDMHETSRVQTDLLDAYVASIYHREQVLQKLSAESMSMPRIIGLRLGTVVGLSRSQRIDHGHMKYICQAFLGGKLEIVHPKSHQSFLGMEDLLRAIAVIVQKRHISKRFDLFNLQSFSTSVAKMANSIALASGAYTQMLINSSGRINNGFSLNTTKFRSTYHFVFNDNQEQIISELIDDVPRLCAGRQSRIDRESVPCVVCGSREMHTVLDLRTQPLANDFRIKQNEALRCKRFPLRLVRCPVCQHAQLSYIVDRSYLFSHYLYQSGTSKSIETYFSWLAEKIIAESKKTNGTVLEIASNDGSQLTQFALRGWNTVGVDPAKNLAELARAKGHTVYVGFWGTDTFSSLPSPDSLDAIVAQNVLAHVSNPVQFLRACASAMGSKTKLYIQTSQCEMYETGQFDTVYHEHVSFFTAHSFKKIANLAGLHITNFEITPIHGRSCLVTFKRIKSSNSTFISTLHRNLAPPLLLALQKERNLGLIDTWFYVKYQAQAQFMRRWIVHQLTRLFSNGYKIIGYGAAAKGIVLLHSLLEGANHTWSFSYIIDDAPLKQNTYCPGTSIPVRPSSELMKHDSIGPLAIVVFAWNFWEEISNKIRLKVSEMGLTNVSVLLPFPQQQLIRIDSSTKTVVTQNTFRSIPWPFPFPSMRKPILLFSYLSNDAALLSSWIRHHASMFDMAVFFHHNVTETSLQIFRDEAPAAWKIIAPGNGESLLAVVDREMKRCQKFYSNTWKTSLTTEEFLVHPNLRGMLAEIENTAVAKALCVRSLVMIGSSSVSFDPLIPPLNQITKYISNSSIHTKLSHFLPSYRCLHHNSYMLNANNQNNADLDTLKWVSNGFIADYRYIPLLKHMKTKFSYTEDTMAETNIISKHALNNFNAIHARFIKQNRKLMQISDLRNIDPVHHELGMAHRLWREMSNL